MQAYFHYPFHTALILVLQACNSLMLFANIWNLVDSFGTNDPQSTGNIINTFYPAPPGATTMNTTVGNAIFVSWAVDTIYTDQFLANATDLQTTALAFDVFSKIFQSYQLHPPDDFEELFDEILHGEVPVTDQTIRDLVLMLIDRFLVSAVYFLVACVCPK
jgi:hypothetical protein